MHTISTLRRTLGLSTDNQVRNRIERIKDILSEHMRRGPNNQIFVTDAGLELLKRFQELYDSGLTLTEASYVLRADGMKTEQAMKTVSSRLASNDTKPTEADAQAHLREEIAFLRSQLSLLRQRMQEAPGTERPGTASGDPWWTRLWEDADVS